jgi:hypothetical protein
MVWTGSSPRTGGKRDQFRKSGTLKVFPAKPEQFLMSFFRTGIAPPALASFGWEQKPKSGTQND